LPRGALCALSRSLSHSLASVDSPPKRLGLGQRAIRAGFDLMMKIMTAFIVVIAIVFQYCSGG